MTAPADQPRPAELLDARHDGPDLTGPLVDFEAEPPADPLLETIAKATREAEGYYWALPEHRAGCESRNDCIARYVLAALLSDAGSTQWGVRWPDETEGPMTRDEAERAARAIADPGRVVRRQVLELHGDWEDAT